MSEKPIHKNVIIQAKALASQNVRHINQASQKIGPFTWEGWDGGTLDDGGRDNVLSKADMPMPISPSETAWKAVLLRGEALLSRSRSCAECDIER